MWTAALENLADRAFRQRLIRLVEASVFARRPPGRRQLGTGPLYMKIGALVRYRPRDIQEWLNGRPVGGDPSDPLQEFGRA